MPGLFWWNIFCVMTVLFIGISQFLGADLDTNRMPFYCTFAGYALFFVAFLGANMGKIYIPYVAKVTILLSLLSAIHAYVSGAQWDLYITIYGTLFSLVLVFTSTVVRLPNVAPDTLVSRMSWALMSILLLTFFQSYSAEEQLRYGLGINFVAVLGIPWILMEKGWKQKILFIMALSVAVFSGKRSAIFIFALIPLIYVFYGSFVGRTKKIKNLSIGLVILILGLAIFFCADAYSEGALSARFSEESLRDGSGRGDSNLAGFKAIQSMSFQELFWGADDTTMVVAAYDGYLGHNELLGSMLNWGVSGMLLYLLLPVALLWRFWTLHREKSNFAVVYLCAVVLLALLSLVSGVFDVKPENVIWCAFVGCFEGLWAFKRSYIIHAGTRVGLNLIK